MDIDIYIVLCGGSHVPAKYRRTAAPHFQKVEKRDFVSRVMDGARLIDMWEIVVKID